MFIDASCFIGLGYLLGPLIGSSIWRMTHRRTMKLIEAKDREFHKHIVKNRVDPTSQSATNPVPDFYGEFVSSKRLYHLMLAPERRREDWITEGLQTGMSRSLICNITC